MYTVMLVGKQINMHNNFTFSPKPKVNNCVGHMNHRFFTLFLFYLDLSCIWVSSLAYVPFTQRAAFDGVQWSGVSPRATLAFVFIITLSISIALGIMLAWHLYLAVSAQTTIEFYFNRWQAQQAAKGIIFLLVFSFMIGFFPPQI